MLRKVIIIVVILNMLMPTNGFATQNISDYKSKNTLKQLLPYLFEEESSTVSRGVCVMSLMKILGVDKGTANSYANADYYVPVFSDLGHDDENAGYIIVAKFSNVAVGIPNNKYDPIRSFESNRNVTVKECLAFILRCLTDSESVSWDNIMEDSVNFGLLQEEELEIYIADAPLTNKQFYTLLCRMFNKNRYLYWPAEELALGYAKSMQVDMTDSIKYIDWFIKQR